MPKFRGFVQSLQVRGDGWVEAILQAVHAGNARQTFFVRDLDGDPASGNRRLAHLSLLRDAVARVLPVEIEYGAGEAGQSNVIDDITIHPRPSFDGRAGARRVEGVVIGCSLAGLGPLSGTTPYLDAADLATITLLEDDGTVEVVRLDLQRPDPLTAQAMLGLLQAAHRTRRPVAVLLDAAVATPGRDAYLKTAAGPAAGGGAGWVQACEWITVPSATLDETCAYVERLGQRYESYEPSEAPALSQVRVVYTTAPGQTPEGDVSDNGTFTPQRCEAWVHADSPLLARLETALRDQLQVRLGLLEARVHSVELVAGLGAIARPIWITVERCPLPPEDDDCACENTPTVAQPGAGALDAVRVRVAWRGLAFFSKGVWRFVLASTGEASLRIDGKDPCCREEGCGGEAAGRSIEQDMAKARVFDAGQRGRLRQCHAYLCGLHHVEVVVSGRRCADPFQLRVYRIR